MTLIVDLPSRRSTTRLARSIAPRLAAGDLLILSGELGSGKTFFTRALCRSLGLPARIRVTSPTFALVHEHATVPPLLHADLYRLERAEDVRDLGLDCRREDGFLVIVEWGGAFLTPLGGDALELSFTTNPRRVELSASGIRSSALLAELSGNPDLAPGQQAPY